MCDSDITKMKVADLKKELKARGLSVMGNKNDLIDRLQSALLDGGDVLEDTANSEDLLEDDELNDDLLDEDKDLTDPVAEDEQILESPTPSEKSKSVSPEQLAETSSLLEDRKNSDSKHAVPTAAQRKISLKRNISITRPTIVTDSTESTPLIEAPKAQRQLYVAPQGGSSSANSGSDGEPDKKVVKLGQLSALERLEMRAKKFGAQPATPTATAAVEGTTPVTNAGAGSNGAKEKLLARAARFGLSGTTTTSSSITSSGENAPPSLDALKKRAERFGGSVSSKMSKLEQEDKLAKRQARFSHAASSAASNGAEKVTSGSADYAEKARLRLERFKSAA